MAGGAAAGRGGSPRSRRRLVSEINVVPYIDVIGGDPWPVVADVWRSTDGLTWEEVDVQPDPKLLQVKYTEDQLEAAPAFKTQEAQQAEADAARMDQQQQLQPQPAAPMTVEPGPAPAATE